MFHFDAEDKQYYAALILAYAAFIAGVAFCALVVSRKGAEHGSA